MYKKTGNLGLVLGGQRTARLRTCAGVWQPIGRNALFKRGAQLSLDRFSSIALHKFFDAANIDFRKVHHWTPLLHQLFGV